MNRIRINYMRKLCQSIGMVKTRLNAYNLCQFVDNTQFLLASHKQNCAYEQSLNSMTLFGSIKGIICNNHKSHKIHDSKISQK